jgi:hypothetical protein
MPETVLRGYLESYWEQGWEGRIEFALQVDEINQPVFLENGQHLTIYGTDEQVLWSGRIKFARRRWWDRHKLAAGIWAWTKQKGVSYAQWMEWFWHKPPLQAELRILEVKNGTTHR